MFRKIPASDFFQGLYETALSPHEILTAIELPITNSNQRVAFKELARRHGDYAIVGVCASCVWSERGISNLRLVFFNISDRPIVSKHAASALTGELTLDRIDYAVKLLSQDLDPLSDLNADKKTRLHLAKVLTRRILKEWIS